MSGEEDFDIISHEEQYAEELPPAVSSLGGHPRAPKGSAKMIEALRDWEKRTGNAPLTMRDIINMRARSDLAQIGRGERP